MWLRGGRGQTKTIAKGIWQSAPNVCSVCANNLYEEQKHNSRQTSDIRRPSHIRRVGRLNFIDRILTAQFISGPFWPGTWFINPQRSERQRTAVVIRGRPAISVSFLDINTKLSFSVSFIFGTLFTCVWAIGIYMYVYVCSVVFRAYLFLWPQFLACFYCLLIVCNELLVLLMCGSSRIWIKQRSKQPDKGWSNVKWVLLKPFIWSTHQEGLIVIGLQTDFLLILFLLFNFSITIIN